MNTRQFIYQVKQRSELLQNIVISCQKLLNSESTLHIKKVNEYLQKRVALDNIEKFEFGYFPSSERIIDLLSLSTKDDLIKANLLYEVLVKDHNNTVLFKTPFEYHNLVFPIRDDYNHIVALIGRSLLSEEELKVLKQPKYKYSKFHKQEVLFGLEKAKLYIRKTQQAMIVEGQLDCMAAQSGGHPYTVALGGTSLNYYQLFLLKKYGAKKIYLALDNDDPGKVAQEKILQKFKNEINWSVVKLPKGIKDLDQYFKQGQILKL